MEDSRGSVVFVVGGNRPTWCHDATRDASLLAENTTKTVTVLDSDNETPAICARLEIINSSGRRASLHLYIARTGVKYPKVDAPSPVAATPPTIAQGKRTYHPLILENGERIILTDRIYKIDETNPAASGGAQAGLGVRYIGSLEPRDR